MEVNLLMIIVIVGVLGGFGLIAWKMGWFKGSKNKIINREEVERGKRVDELRYNGRTITDEVRDSKGNLKMKITHEYRKIRGLGKIESITPRNDANKRYFEFVYRPRKYWIIPQKPKPILLGEDVFTKNWVNKEIIISPEVAIQKRLTWHYDLPNEKVHNNTINEAVNKTNWENLTSANYVDLQKYSVLNEEARTQAMLKEKEIQLELAKKGGKMESI